MFNSKNGTFLTPGEDRRWSDDQGYLDTINFLIFKSHEASMDDDNVMDWYFILEQLQLEITGQLVLRGLVDDLASLKALREKTLTDLQRAYQQLGNKSLSSFDVSKLRRLVFPYHELINILIHKMDLRLHDVKPSSDGEIPDFARS